MAYLVKRIRLKSGERVPEREVLAENNYSDGEAPVVGDEIVVRCRGRTFRAKVAWGNWPKNAGIRDPNKAVPLRVEEI
jgi:hypothetical protein